MPSVVGLLNPTRCCVIHPLSSVSRIISVESCRKFKELFVEVRERASKAIGFAKMLRKVRGQRSGVNGEG